MTLRPNIIRPFHTQLFPCNPCDLCAVLKLTHNQQTHTLSAWSYSIYSSFAMLLKGKTLKISLVSGLDIKSVD